MMDTGKSDWLNTVKDTFDLIGRSDIWNNKGSDFEYFPVHMIQTQLKERFNSQWECEINTQLSPDKKLRTYARFKHKFYYENYLCAMKNVIARKSFARLRISAHNLPIETGRHRRPNKIPSDQRFCDKCPEIGDEFHYILACPKFSKPRQKLINSLNDTFVEFINFNEEEKFLFIMGCRDLEIIYAVESFMSACIEIGGPI